MVPRLSEGLTPSEHSWGFNEATIGDKGHLESSTAVPPGGLALVMNKTGERKDLFPHAFIWEREKCGLARWGGDTEDRRTNKQIS